MNNPTTSAPRVAVIGGGISGLATAHRLAELAPQLSVTLVDRADRVGGVLQTAEQDGFLFEWGPDNFITNVPWGIALCRRIGFADQLLETDDQHRGAFVVRRGRLHRIPQGFIIMAPSRMWPVVTTPILSPWGKLRMAAEFFVPPRREEGDESLAAFVTRRFGQETYDRLVQPLIGGIYTGDPRLLSLQATMPRFREMEQGHGSLIRAIMRQVGRRTSADRNSSGGRYSMFVAPRRGMFSLVQAVADRLPAGTIRLGACVRRIMQQNGVWTLELEGRHPPLPAFDAVVLATPAKATAELIQPLDGILSDQVSQIHHSSCCIVSLAYQRDQVSHPMDGFGFVVPAVEQREIISGSFASVKYPGRAPDGHVLLRVFIGGALQEELLELPDDRLLSIAHREMAQLLGIRGEPLLHRLARLPASMPQYYVGHGERVATIHQRAAAIRGLFLTGNAYEGVGVPVCIHGGEKAAQRVVDFLQNGANK